MSPILFCRVRPSRQQRAADAAELKHNRKRCQSAFNVCAVLARRGKVARCSATSGKHADEPGA